MKKKLFNGFLLLCLGVCLVTNSPTAKAVEAGKGSVIKTICCSNGTIIGYSSNCGNGNNECVNQSCNSGTEVEATACPKSQE